MKICMADGLPLAVHLGQTYIVSAFSLRIIPVNGQPRRKPVNIAESESIKCHFFQHISTHCCVYLPTKTN